MLLILNNHYLINKFILELLNNIYCLLIFSLNRVYAKNNTKHEYIHKYFMYRSVELSFYNLFTVSMPKNRETFELVCIVLGKDCSAIHEWHEMCTIELL
jgi:hypothetical protein